MKVVNWTASALLALSVAGASPAHAFGKKAAGKDDPRVEVAKLAKKSRREARRCASQDKKIEAWLAQNHWAEEESGELADLVSLLEAHPGESQAALKAAWIFYNQSRLYKSRPIDAYREVRRCNLSTQFNASRVVLQRARELKVGHPLRKRASELVYARVKAGLDQPVSWVGLQLQLLLIKSLVGQGFLVMSDPVYVAFTEIQEKVSEQRDLLYQRDRNEGPSWYWPGYLVRRKYLRDFVDEYIVSTRIARRMLSLLPRAERSLK